MRDPLPLLDKIPFPAIRRGRLATLQVNVGYRCNQSCFHCHVNAGPTRTEEMSGAGALGAKVMDRCNLTILQQPGQEDLAEFLSQQRVEVVASMPCYLADNVERQRGKGVFDGSFQALRKLNAIGSGP